MQLVTNKIKTDKVRTEQFRGKEYLVAPVVPMKSMELDKGYVPEEEVKKSAPAWNGIPLTLSHPENDNGDLISANAPEVADSSWLGFLFNNKSVNDGEKTEGEAWFDIEGAREAGGKARNVIERAENGQPLSVSTSYYFDRLEPGEYDGEYRNNVSGNLRPDHVAVLLDQDGKCSIEDGCVIGEQAVNSDVTGLTVASITDDSVSPENGQDEDHDTDAPNDHTSDESNNEDTDGRGNDKVSEDDMTGEGQSAEAATHFERFMQSINLGGGGGESEEEQTEDESAESDAENENMTEKTEELVSNHGFDAENLPSEESDCFDKIYQAFAGNNEEEEEQESQESDTSDDVDDTTDSEDQNFDLSEEFEDLKEDIRQDAREAAKEAIQETNEEKVRDELVAEIAGNSDDYDEESLQDTPVPVLENIRDDVTSEDSLPTDFSAQLGASANAGGSEDSNFPSLSANERNAEIEDED